MGGRQDDMALYIVRLYGKDCLTELMQLKYQTKKHTRVELEEMIDKYKKKVEELNVGRN
jgi:hypothetical protein